MSQIELDNDFEPEKDITRKNTTTGAIEAATGLTGLTARISATDGGSTIHASLSVSVTERSAKAGTYSAIFQGDDLRTHLAGSVGIIVWIVFGDGTNVLVSDPYTVIERRRSA